MSSGLPEYMLLPHCMKYSITRRSSIFWGAICSSCEYTSAYCFFNDASACFTWLYRRVVRLPFLRGSSSRVTSMKMLAGGLPAIPEISSTMRRAWLTPRRSAGEPGRSASSIAKDVPGRSLLIWSIFLPNPSWSSWRISIKFIAAPSRRVLFGSPSSRMSMMLFGPLSVSTRMPESSFLERRPHPV